MRLPKKPVGMTPQRALKDFFAEMRAWERVAHRELRASVQAGRDLDKDRLVRERLAVIARHCTPKRRVYSGVIAYRIPSEYASREAKVVKVVEESPRRIRAFTQKRFRTALQYCFVLLKRGDRWLIDSKQWQSIDGKWERAVL